MQRLIYSFLFFIPLFAVVIFFRPISQASDWESKVDPRLLTGGRASTTTFIIELDRLPTVDTAHLKGKNAKAQHVYDTLRAHAIATQPEVVAVLTEAEATYRQHWINNTVVATGDVGLIQTIAQLDSVQFIAANIAAKIETPLPDTFRNLPRITSSNSMTVTWGISKTEAYRVWDELGVTGAGITVGGADTGYDWQHIDLKAQYRGWDGSSADHSYNWHDAIHKRDPKNNGENTICGYTVAFPCDDFGHGTHTMGTMVGRDNSPTGTAIGMAPDADWVACRNMERGWGTPDTYAECFEWFIAPYPYLGSPLTDGDPTKSPHVIANSWSCPSSEGCTDPLILQAATEQVRAAGIFPVVSAGNSGSTCGSVNTPAAIYDASFTVGSTQQNGAISSFSSRGPVTRDGSNRPKPDISAPGSGVYSTILNNDWGNSSGTSMAGPHVAGLVALIIASNPDLDGEIALIETIIRQTATPKYTNETCGGDSPSSLPNHTFGSGEINAYAAVLMAQQINVLATEMSSIEMTHSVTPIYLLVATLLLFTGVVWWRVRTAIPNMTKRVS